VKESQVQKFSLYLKGSYIKEKEFNQEINRIIFALWRNAQGYNKVNKLRLVWVGGKSIYETTSIIQAKRQ
jgi:hypothetical protein